MHCCCPRPIQSSIPSMLAAFLLAACFVISADLSAQNSSAPAASPQVQQLYAEAKAAQAGGDDVTAIAKYHEMIKLAPRLAPAYNNLGMLYFNSGDFRHAAEVLEQGLKINPDMPSASVMLGSAYYEMGDY